MALQHLRSSTANKRPTPGSMSDGQLALNTNVASPGAFFKDSTGALVKAGPVHVGTTAPNASPAVGGQSGNSIGEQWLDTSASPAQLKVWNGTAWVSALPDELPVSKLQDGAARQLLQTDAAGTGVEWTSNVDVPGTLDVTGAATFDSTVSIGGSNALVASDIGSTVQAYDADTAKTDATQTFTAAQTFGDNVTLNAQSDLRFADADSSNWIALQAPSTVASNVTWTLPNADGTSGQVLSTDGAGALSWATAAAGAGDKIEEGNTSAEVIDTGSDGRFVVTTEGTEALRVDSSQRVGIGTTNPSYALHVQTASGGGIEVIESTSGTSKRLRVLNNSTGTIYNATAGVGTGTHQFQIDGSEALRIDGSRRLLVGTSSAYTAYASSDSAKYQQVGSNYQSASIQTATFAATSVGGGLTLALSRNATPGSHTVVQNGDTLGQIRFMGSDGTSFKPCALIAGAVDGTPGTNDMPGRLVFSTTADGASSPTERMRIDNAGDVHIAKAAYTSISTNGHTFDKDGWAHHSANSEALLYLNRNVDDGNLIVFHQAGVAEGTISVSGSTVSYNGAHLSRWSRLSGIDPYDKTVRPEILRGTVMSNLDEMCDWTCPTSGDCQDNEQLNKTQISDVEGDKNVAGVFQSWDDDDDTWVNDFYLAMTGDFVIRIAAGTTVQRGDLLMSAGDGTAKPQDDDIIRSKTIAKVTSTNVSCTYPDSSYCVPCVLMAC